MLLSEKHVEREEQLGNEDKEEQVRGTWEERMLHNEWTQGKRPQEAGA